jgi:hypothetical protein
MSEGYLGAVGGVASRPIYSFTRTGNTVTYSSGDLVANTTVATTVAACSWASSRSGSAIGGGMLRRVWIKSTSTSITNASYRLHLYGSSPTVANGDNGAFSSTESDYLGYCDVTVGIAFSDGSAGYGIPATGTDINYTQKTLYGLLEARASRDPISGETFTIGLELLPN